MKSKEYNYFMHAGLRETSCFPVNFFLNITKNSETTRNQLSSNKEGLNRFFLKYPNNAFKWHKLFPILDKGTYSTFKFFLGAYLNFDGLWKTMRCNEVTREENGRCFSCRFCDTDKTYTIITVG